MGCYLSRDANIKSQKKKIKKMVDISEEEIEVKSDSNDSEIDEQYHESKILFKYFKVTKNDKNLKNNDNKSKQIKNIVIKSKVRKMKSSSSDDKNNNVSNKSKSKESDKDIPKVNKSRFHEEFDSKEKNMIIENVNDDSNSITSDFFKEKEVKEIVNTKVSKKGYKNLINRIPLTLPHYLELSLFLNSINLDEDFFENFNLNPKDIFLIINYKNYFKVYNYFQTKDSTIYQERIIDQTKLGENIKYLPQDFPCKFTNKMNHDNNEYIIYSESKIRQYNLIFYNIYLEVKQGEYYKLASAEVPINLLYSRIKTHEKHNNCFDIDIQNNIYGKIGSINISIINSNSEFGSQEIFSSDLVKDLIKEYNRFNLLSPEILNMNIFLNWFNDNSFSENCLVNVDLMINDFIYLINYEKLKKYYFNPSNHVDLNVSKSGFGGRNYNEDFNLKAYIRNVHSNPYIFSIWNYLSKINFDFQAFIGTKFTGKSKDSSMIEETQGVENIFNFNKYSNIKDEEIKYRKILKNESKMDKLKENIEKFQELINSQEIDLIRNLIITNDLALYQLFHYLTLVFTKYEQNSEYIRLINKFSKYGVNQISKAIFTNLNETNVIKVKINKGILFLFNIIKDVLVENIVSRNKYNYELNKNNENELNFINTNSRISNNTNIILLNSFYTFIINFDIKLLGEKYPCSDLISVKYISEMSNYIIDDIKDCIHSLIHINILKFSNSNTSTKISDNKSRYDKEDTKKVMNVRKNSENENHSGLDIAKFSNFTIENIEDDKDIDAAEYSDYASILFNYPILWFNSLIKCFNNNLQILKIKHFNIKVQNKHGISYKMKQPKIDKQNISDQESFYLNEIIEFTKNLNIIIDFFEVFDGLNSGDKSCVLTHNILSLELDLNILFLKMINIFIDYSSKFCGLYDRSIEEILIEKLFSRNGIFLNFMLERIKKFGSNQFFFKEYLDYMNKIISVIDGVWLFNMYEKYDLNLHYILAVDNNIIKSLNTSNQKNWKNWIQYVLKISSFTKRDSYKYSDILFLNDKMYNRLINIVFNSLLVIFYDKKFLIPDCEIIYPDKSDNELLVLKVKSMKRYLCYPIGIEIITLLIKCINNLILSESNFLKFIKEYENKYRLLLTYCIYFVLISFNSSDEMLSFSEKNGLLLYEFYKAILEMFVNIFDNFFLRSKVTIFCLNIFLVFFPNIKNSYKQHLFFWDNISDNIKKKIIFFFTVKNYNVSESIKKEFQNVEINNENNLPIDVLDKINCLKN